MNVFVWSDVLPLRLIVARLTRSEFLASPTWSVGEVGMPVAEVQEVLALFVSDEVSDEVEVGLARDELEDEFGVACLLLEVRAKTGHGEFLIDHF